MNANHLHLMLNHLPVLGTAFGLGLLLFGLVRKSSELKKTALGVFVIVALAAVPVYLTGEPAEDGVESLPGVSKPVIKQHEEAAGAAFTGVVVLGVAALGGLILFRRGRALPVWFSVSLLVASLIVTGLMAWTANLGGQIRHSEIRAGNSPPAATGAKIHD
jgi:uncharacterized membrane protein